MRIRFAVQALAAVSIATASPVAARAADAAIDAFVHGVNEVVLGMEAGDRADVRRACTALVERAFDVGAMAPPIAGDAWPRMNSGQRAAYIRGLSRRAVSDCVAHGGEVAGNAVELVGVRDAGEGDRLVAVRQTKGRKRTVIWQVRAAASGRLKAVDMTVDGHSTAVSARRDAKKVLEQSGGNVIALLKSVGE